MANPEHFKILKQGIEAWGKWRRENPGLRPDLSGLNLMGINLFEADLSRAILRNTNLKKANLREVDLSGSILMRADLSEAIITKAQMVKTNLQQSDLIGAKLAQANLQRANLRKVDLFGADLTGADLREADLAAADLSSAIISGTRLYGSVRDDWKIDGIICDHVYWDAQGYRRIPAEGKFKDHQFESIYKSLPTPADHFTASLAQQTGADILVLKRNDGEGRLKLTATVFSKSVLDYLNAVAELQHLVHEFSDDPGAEVAIRSISQQKHITVEIMGAGPLLNLIRETIIPWRRRYAGEVEKIDRAVTRASIIEREADILEIRSNTDKNAMEARMLEAEAAKMRTEARLLTQKAEEMRRYIYKEMEADLFKLLPVETLSKSRLAQFKSRSAAPLQLLAQSDLAD